MSVASMWVNFNVTFHSWINIVFQAPTHPLTKLPARVRIVVNPSSHTFPPFIQVAAQSNKGRAGSWGMPNELSFNYWYRDWVTFWTKFIEEKPPFNNKSGGTETVSQWILARHRKLHILRRMLSLLQHPPHRFQVHCPLAHLRLNSMLHWCSGMPSLQSWRIVPNNL